MARSLFITLGFLKTPWRYLRRRQSCWEWFLVAIASYSAVSVRILREVLLVIASRNLYAAVKPKTNASARGPHEG
jgi:hypothetical protein